jgi:uncharacterized protein
MTFLLDVNVLIALIDEGHVHHSAAHRWFQNEGRLNFATCPITENGVLRIAGNPNYSGSPGSPVALMPAVSSLRAMPGHHFWSDDLSLLSSDLVSRDRVLSHRQITDTYLLALAVNKSGRLATLDRRLVPDAVVGGAAALCLIAQ